ncbi:unnamed protein product, partial [Cyprideis torosa]
MFQKVQEVLPRKKKPRGSNQSFKNMQELSRKRGNIREYAGTFPFQRECSDDRNILLEEKEPEEEVEEESDDDGDIFSLGNEGWQYEPQQTDEEFQKTLQALALEEEAGDEDQEDEEETCECGKCSEELLTRQRCCAHFPECDAFRKPTPCVTDDPDFQAACLNETTLKTLDSWPRAEVDDEEEKRWTNRTKRHLAYVQSTLVLHG